MTERDQARPELKDYGQTWEIAAALWDGPKTLPEIVGHFYSYIRLLGLFRVTKRMERRHGKMAERIEDAVEALVERGWVVRQGERYALTPAGRVEAETPISHMHRTRPLLRKLTRPQTVSQVGLGVHLGLAALKLPAARAGGGAAGGAVGARDHVGRAGTGLDGARSRRELGGRGAARGDPGHCTADGRGAGAGPTADGGGAKTRWLIGPHGEAAQSPLATSHAEPLPELHWILT
jgi:hypothetical protein